MMYKIIAIALVTITCSACVNLNLDNVVSDTVDASKELFNTIKRKRNGEEEREYSHTLISAEESLDTERSVQCINQIKANIEASSIKLTKVISESSDINIVEDARKLTCKLIVLVKPTGS